MEQYKEVHINSLNKEELEKLAKMGQLIDVRTKEEYELGHINGSTLHPVEKRLNHSIRIATKRIIYIVKAVTEALKLAII